MIRAIVQHQWSDELQDFIAVPLDDCDPWVIEANRRFAGTNYTVEELKSILEVAPIEPFKRTSGG